jgi:hypothetical protein
MPDFSRIISMAYVRILERPPDAGGLAAYNDAMNAGLSEALMRESLLRSPEYAEKNPGGPTPAPAAALAVTRKAPRPAKGKARPKR